MFPFLTTSNFEFNKFGLLLSQYDYKVKKNDILAGSIIGLESTHALVDLGLEKIAFLPLTEITIKKTGHQSKLLNINFIGEFLILDINEKTEQILVSLRYVHSLCLWERLKQIDFKHTIIYAKNEKSLNKGKLLSFNGLKIFSQNSHIPKYYRRKKDRNFFMPFKFIEIKDSVHISHVNSRLAIFSKFSRTIKIGSNYLGNVTSIKNFGIFVNVLGIQCLLHISNIPKRKKRNLNMFYKRGDQIGIEILYKDIERGKITVILNKSEFNHHPQLL
uniref:Ribosomal protein S1 n=1 Tax=Protohalopteris sp. TaxID=2843287 RepID=A0A8F0F7B2_9PHAE|nr:ribosomal protein S1 [Protohalopteris sp.]